ncbi:MAG: hypothetical protein A2020_13800 [Lentisphaerae bacterium GWF2_45_14]|nr:MAG: hypothetical protein A2020_13800 [Lentisphaerae bacterium GWF2_45_14]
MKAKGKSDTLAKAKKKKQISLLIAALFVTGLVIYGIIRPSEDKEVDQIKNSILSLTEQEDANAANSSGHILNVVRGKRSKAISQEDLDNIRNTMKELSPKTRKVITREVMRARIKRIRKATENMTEEQKQEAVQKMVDEIREKFKNMDKKSRDAAKDKMNSEEGKEEAKEALDTYYNDFTAQERQTYDPAINELLNNVNAL